MTPHVIEYSFTMFLEKIDISRSDTLAERSCGETDSSYIIQEGMNR